MIAPCLLSARGLTRRADDGRVLLQATDFDVYAGERIGVQGASGGGKSVLLRCMALLDWPDGGEIRWRGEPVGGAAAVLAYRTQAAYVRQQPVLVSGSVADNLRLPFTLAAYRQRRQDMAAIDKMLSAIGRSRTFLDADSANLSGGEAQLVCLMRVLQLNPFLLLLDEPTAALDAESAAAAEALVQAWLSARGQEGAYVWISHSPEQLARMADKVWTVRQGVLETEAQDA